ncbi:GM10406 [Drosophila sechellia]|uniref:GM10406 n=1 Tax=Drosophila sechellia TaxID=7238 RepID=B4ILH7_DROSE|nr:GM10406 [Drosophila sechellia]
MSLTLSALKHLGLRQCVGGWTHVALVSIASSESLMLKRGKRLCPIPKSTLLVATIMRSNSVSKC